MAENTSNPRTIEELRQWYAAQGLPPEEVTRFFIGTNYTEPRAFGIYQEGDRFIVYKNKDDGSRAVRYHGPDEAYAVRELQMRLEQEMQRQRKPKADPKKERRKKIGTWIFIIACVAYFIYMQTGGPRAGYYYTNDSYYYYDGGRMGTWYAVDDYNTYDEVWYPSDYDYDTYGDDYYYADSDSSLGYESAHSEYSSSSDSDYSSWDSSSTDFSSDW